VAGVPRDFALAFGVFHNYCAIAMGFFTRTDSRQDDRLAAVQGECEALRSRLTDLESEVRGLVTPVRDLTMEWEDWFEKFRNLYGRISKRQEREKVSENGEAPDTPMSPAAAALLRQGAL